MKISKVLHVLSVISGVIGVISLFGTWGGSGYGMMGNINSNVGNMMSGSPVIYFLIAIWLQLGTMHHMKLEEKGEIV